MRVKFNYAKRWKKVVVLALALMFVGFSISLAIFGRIGSFPTIFGIPYSGIAGAAQVGLAMGMVILEYDLGGVLAIILLGTSFISSLVSALAMGNMQAIQGTCYLVISIVLAVFIRTKIKAERKIGNVDDLTGISNRRNATDYMDHLLVNRRQFYMLHIGVKNMRTVNETKNLKTGDKLIIDFTKAWGKIDSEHTFLARHSGSDFLAIIEKKHCHDVEAYAKRFVDVVREVAEEEDSDYYYLSASVGIAESAKRGITSQDMLKNAEIAFNYACSCGKNNVVIYQHELENGILREKMIEARIKKAVENDLFYMVYQPQFTARDKTLRGFESLIRMKTAEGEAPIYPGEFIPVAEQSDLIISIGEYVLRHVLSEFSPLLRGRSDIIVSVNISSKQLLSRGFIDLVKKVLDETDFYPMNLEIEITEYCLMDTDDMAAGVLNELKAMGIKIAMDDFGTGYSSLAYLTKLPIDLIKIDKSIVDEIGDGDIVSAICSMGHSLGCEIIAEGVEEERQLHILKEKQCDLIQGYIWSKPLEFENAKRLL